MMSFAGGARGDLHHNSRDSRARPWNLVSTDGGGCDAVRTALIGHRNVLCPAQGRDRSRLARVVAPDVFP